MRPQRHYRIPISLCGLFFKKAYIFLRHVFGGSLKMEFSNLNRQEIVTQLKSNIFDVLIIGGGITGAGIALDATTRGMKTALVEMQDFSSGTSSRSTKLVHGGLRYLKQFEVKMVAEVGKERAIVFENGPHVTSPEKMLLPLHKGGTFGKLSTSIGLTVYDWLAEVKKGERRKMLSTEETLLREPLIKKDGLLGSGYYVEYRTDDSRLTIEVMKAAHEYGAMALNYTRVEKLKYQNNRIIGVYVKDQISGDTYEILAREIVNAAGPWVDSIREMDNSKKGKLLKLSKGVHIVIDQSRFSLKQAVYFDTQDGRMIFAIPRDGKVYIGTTDTFYEEDVTCPSVTINDREYIMKAINYMFPSVKISDNDIESSWAGIRPLIYEEGKKPSEISRRDEVWQSESGLITIAGGKLTGYRKMAETIVDLLVVKLKKQTNKPYTSCITRKLPISGGDIGGSKKFGKFILKQVERGQLLGLKRGDATNLTKTYGSNVTKIFELIEPGKLFSETFNIPLSITLKLLYAIHFEMIASPVDFFYRRTSDLLFDIRSVQMLKKNVVSLMGNIFKWDKNMEEYYLHELEREIKLVICKK